MAADTSRGLGVIRFRRRGGLCRSFECSLQGGCRTGQRDDRKKRLLIVADGGLNYIPFEALVKTGASGDYSSLPYYNQSNEIVYAPPVQRRSNSAAGTRSAGRAMLIVADPVFNSNDTRARTVAAAAPSGETRGLGIESALTDVTGQGAVAAAESAKDAGSAPCAALRHAH